MLAASISFYTMLSLAPGLWIVVAAAGAIVGRESARAGVLARISQSLGPLPAHYLGDIIDQVNESSRLATIGGIIAVFFGATAAFAALQTALARVWNLPEPTPETFLASLRDFLKNFFTNRMLAFVAMLVLGLLLVASLIAGAAMTFIENRAPASIPGSHLMIVMAEFVLSSLLMLLLFAFLYYMLHRSSFAHGEIWIGAAVTALLFGIGNALIGHYLGSAGIRSAYGAAGSFVLLLLWVYYSTQILLFGAAFTEVYARKPQTTAGPRV
jgi:membrane protein